MSCVLVGSVKLASSDPFTFPLIDPAFYTSPFDAYAMAYAIKSARRFVQTSPWKDFIVGPYAQVSTASTDDEIIAAARANSITIWHPTCTARMSPKNASWGVVDPNLLVKGTTGLRIVDASVLVSGRPHVCAVYTSDLTFLVKPVLPAGHPIAAVYILAERAADLIKQAWY